MLRRAIELRRSQPGANPADVATTLKSLAAVLRQRSRMDEALPLVREALALQRRLLGPSHPEVALTLTAVADLMNDPAAAESLYRQARDIQRAALGPDDVAVAYTDVFLAGFRTEQRAYADAEALFRESMEIRSRRLGPEHPITATSMIHLADLLDGHLNRPAEAESLYTRAVEILRKQPPRWLPNLAGALSGLTGIVSDRGDHVRAEALAREMLDAQRRTFGVDHPMVTDAMSAVAGQLAAQGRLAEAEAIVRDAIATLERTVGPRHDRVARALLDIARVRSAAGRRVEAEADLRRALAIMETNGPPTRWQGVVDALLADLLARRGETMESGALFDQAASILKPLGPQIGPEFHAAYAALAEHYAALRRSSDEADFRRLAQGRTGAVDSIARGAASARP
jgi:tetratricopeptide (TPR) repeat protein